MPGLPRIACLAFIAVIALLAAASVSHARKVAPTAGVVNANTAFAIDLFHRLAAENTGDNLFLSPYSISSALAMTAEGARGQTALEMGKVLGYQNGFASDKADRPWHMSGIHAGFGLLNNRFNRGEDPAIEKKRAEVKNLRKELAATNDRAAKLQQQSKWDEARMATVAASHLVKKIDQLASQIDQYELKVANALWGEKTYPFEQAYVDTIAESYGTGGISNVDFKNQFPAARKTINDWVADQTEQRIKDIIPDMPPAQARLVRLILTNAIYFKGEWEKPFEEKRTKDLAFHRADGSNATTPIMHAPGLEVARYGAFNADGSPFGTPHRIGFNEKPAAGKHYPTPDGFAMVELPYKGGDLSMVVIAPNSPGGLAGVQKKLTPDNLRQWIGKLNKRKAHVYLPKFKLETEYKMAETLQAMGMKRAFTDPRDPHGADFTGMSASKSLEDRLYISKVIHKAFVEVNEKGTEAAAATAVIMAGAASAPLDRPFVPEFRADRPFLYLIHDKATGTILFMGRMTDPTAK